MRQLLWTLALSVFAISSQAETDSWDDIRSALYGSQPLLAGEKFIAIDAPYRTPMDSRADLAAHVVAPKDAAIREVTVILDENPMPVSAVFSFDNPPPRFYFDVTMRVNGPTPMHVVMRTTDGRLFVQETFVKTTGQGACSAPPGTDPDLALETLGNMEIEVAGRLPTDVLDPIARFNRLDVNIDHPSHSGMQMDQITLLFTPMRYVENVDIDLDGTGYLQMEGSISLSENPRVGISVPSSALSVDVTMTDTDGTVSHKNKRLTGF